MVEKHYAILCVAMSVKCVLENIFSPAFGHKSK